MNPEDDIKTRDLKQGEKENLKDFIKRYHRAILELETFNHPQVLRGLKERVKIGQLWYNMRAPAINSYLTVHVQLMMDIEIEKEKVARVGCKQLEELRRKERRAQRGSGPVIYILGQVVLKTIEWCEESTLLAALFLVLT